MSRTVQVLVTALLYFTAGFTDSASPSYEYRTSERPPAVPIHSEDHASTDAVGQRGCLPKDLMRSYISNGLRVQRMVMGVEIHGGWGVKILVSVIPS